MKKRLLSLMLSLIMIVGLLPINTFAAETGTDPYEGYTTAEVSTQEGLLAAINAVNANTPTVIVLKDDQVNTYSFPLMLDNPTASMSNKTIVFKADGDVKLDMNRLSDNNCQHLANAILIFDGLEIEMDHSGWYVSSYVGLGNVKDLAYRNCKISGAQYLNAKTVEFTNCTLVSTNSYCITTYGATDVTITGCTFNTAGKAVNVYSGGSKGYTVNVALTNCIFNSDSSVADNKAAVEVSDNDNKDSIYNVTITDCTANNFVSNNSTSSLWGNKNSLPHDRLIVNLDGVEVTAPYVDMSGINLAGKVYDGQPLTYTGEASVKTYLGEVLHNNAPVPFTYQWYEKNDIGNFVEMNSGEVPKAVGEYKLKATIRSDVTVTRLLNNEDSGYTASVKITNPTYTVTVPGITDPIGILNGCTLTVDPNGGTWAAPNDFTAESDGTYTLAVTGDVDLTEVADPVKDEHRFIGWDKTTDADGNVTLTAQWEKVVFTVTFDPNGGSVSPTSAQTAADGTLGSLPTPTRGGMYIFDGWYTAPNGGTRVTTSTVFTEDTTIYAHWDYFYIPAPTYYKLSFDTNGGSTISSITRVSGTVVDLTDYVPTREGYTFDGWYLDEGLTNEVTSVKLTKNTTVYAGWEKDEIDEPDTPDIPDYLNGKDHFAYIVGYDDGMVHPEASITRAEVATIFFRLLNEDVRSAYLTSTNNFLDVPADLWYTTPVSTMAAMGVLKGYEGYFRPNDPITRAEFAAIAARFADETGTQFIEFKDISGHWAELEIMQAASLGWVEGYNGYYRPNDEITRAEAMTIINRVLCRVPETVDDLLPGMKVWADNMDTSKWYYLAVQEATNSHTFVYKDNTYESWVALTSDPDWSKYQ